jgi:ACDE family multidrug resistance protein
MEEAAAVVPLRPVYRDPNLQIVFGVTLMAVLGVSSITPAFPKIVDELGIPPQHVGSLITVFTFPGVLLTAVLGVLADHFGRKKILVPALLLFAVAGSACALSRDFSVLLVLRFFQGVGAAGLGALNLTVIGDLFTGRERTAAMGCNSSVLSLGTASYPAIGGALATLGWFYPFALPLAAIPVALAVFVFLKNPEPGQPQPFAEYLAHAWRAVASRQVVGLFAVSTLTFIILYGSYMTYFPMLIKSSFGVAPLAIGLIMSVSSLSTALTSSQAGRLASALSQKALIGVSCLMYASALVAIPLVSNIWLFALPVTVFGAAQGINLPSLMALLADQAPMEQRGALMSINGMVLRLGQTLGPLLMGMVFATGGLGGVFIAGAACAMVMLVVVVGLMR